MAISQQPIIRSTFRLVLVGVFGDGRSNDHVTDDVTVGTPLALTQNISISVKDTRHGRNGLAIGNPTLRVRQPRDQ